MDVVLFVRHVRRGCACDIEGLEALYFGLDSYVAAEIISLKDSLIPHAIEREAAKTRTEESRWDLNSRRILATELLTQASKMQILSTETVSLDCSPPESLNHMHAALFFLL